MQNSIIKLSIRNQTSNKISITKPAVTKKILELVKRKEGEGISFLSVE